MIELQIENSGTSTGPIEFWSETWAPCPWYRFRFRWRPWDARRTSQWPASHLHQFSASIKCFLENQRNTRYSLDVDGNGRTGLHWSKKASCFTMVLGMLSRTMLNITDPGSTGRKGYSSLISRHEMHWLRHLEIEWRHKETGRQRAEENRKISCSPQFCCIPTRKRRTKWWSSEKKGMKKNWI